MSPTEVAEYLRRRPFQPFRVFLSEESHHTVRHPELALLRRRELQIVIEPVESVSGEQSGG